MAKINPFSRACGIRVTKVSEWQNESEQQVKRTMQLQV